MPRSSATSHELARVELLAGLPGQTLAQLATTAGVIAVTVAVRGMFIASATSPK